MVYHFSVRLLLCCVFEITEYEFCKITPLVEKNLLLEVSRLLNKSVLFPFPFIKKIMKNSGQVNHLNI